TSSATDIFQAVRFFRMECCPTQAVLPLVGLAADTVIRDRYISGGSIFPDGMLPDEAVLPLVGLAAENVIRDRYIRALAATGLTSAGPDHPTIIDLPMRPPPAPQQADPLARFLGPLRGASVPPCLHAIEHYDKSLV
ncbi:MAG: hypothetical protein ACQESR_28690, partial [Planctomycetota bacterium]